MMDEVVDDLLCEEVLYDPLALLRDKYPEYLTMKALTGEPITEEQESVMTRHMEHLNKMCEHFEGGTHNVPKEKQKIFDLLGELEEIGQIPEELMKMITDELEAQEKAEEAANPKSSLEGDKGDK